MSYVLKNIQTIPSSLNIYLKKYSPIGYMRGQCVDTNSLDDAYVIKDRNYAEALCKKISKYALVSYVVVELINKEE